ncbi:hypothetical protein H632_c136p3 [Helicosporidium sp. ATCC 50920]|nr:hypothetical protein H632_c136p3 [Helicosporidium sp. ATCC 50920]|eukprot:KDD76695.1 hypothetical protein H632_c136p3 [Helicosporidium sp. ATCC 50920]
MGAELEAGSRTQAESLDSTQTGFSLDQARSGEDEPERWIGGVGQVSFALPPGSRSRPTRERTAPPSAARLVGAPPVAAMEEDEEADVAASEALSRVLAGRATGAARRPRARPQFMDEDERA